ncbi:MAG: peptidylprolyl isomerase [Spirochaetales bacterium]|nr:peptidylprolyl isomerase [Spirochaetales bacterium]
MKKSLFIFLFTYFAAFLFADVLSVPLVSVNLIRPEMITAQEVDEKIDLYNKQLISNGLPQQDIKRSDMLDSMISSILIAQAAEQSGVVVSDLDINRVIQSQKQSAENQLHQRISDDQFKQLIINQTSGSWDLYIARISEQLLQQTYITQNKKSIFENIKLPSSEEIEIKYKENMQRFFNTEYLRVSMIFIPILNKNIETSEAAGKKLEKAYNELKNGNISFDDAVIKYSEEESVKYRGGDIGYVGRDNSNLKLQLGEDFFNKMFQLSKDEISDVLESNTGLHILKITDKLEAKLLGLDDTMTPDSTLLVRDYLKNVLLQDKQQQALEKALKEINFELREKAEIIFF